MRRSLWLLTAASLAIGPALHAQDRRAQDRQTLPSLDYLQMEEPGEPLQTDAPPAEAGEPRLEMDMPASEDALSVAPPPVSQPEAAASEPVALPEGEPRNPRDIEDGTGGRLGVALVDAKGRLLLGFNREDRFAFCSTFKAPLAAAVLAKVGAKGLDRKVKISVADVISHSPAVESQVKSGQISIRQLLQGAVELSDNGAANLLLPMIGGPAGLTDYMRGRGDAVSRLDRTEPTLNENATGDPRDTTTPEAMAGLMAKLLYESPDAAAAKTLAGWMAASPTGAKRIRAGLPAGWSGGDKTGTCGNAYNDVAFIRSPEGQDYVLAVYLDRPTVPGPQAEAAIAEIARAVAVMLGRRASAAPVAAPPAVEPPKPMAMPEEPIFILPPRPAPVVVPEPAPAIPPPKAPRSVLTTPDTR